VTNLLSTLISPKVAAHSKAWNKAQNLRYPSLCHFCRDIRRQLIGHFLQRVQSSILESLKVLFHIKFSPSYFTTFPHSTLPPSSKLAQVKLSYFLNTFKRILEMLRALLSHILRCAYAFSIYFLLPSSGFLTRSLSGLFESPAFLLESIGEIALFCGPILWIILM